MERLARETHSHRRKFELLGVRASALIMVAAGCLIGAGLSHAGDPDPAFSFTDWDNGLGFVNPGPGGDDDFRVYIRDNMDQPVEGADVTVAITGCPELCVDGADDGLSGTSDVNGEVVLNPRIGGCADCTMELWVAWNGNPPVLFASRPVSIASTDLGGARPDGRVACDDEEAFQIALGQGDPCADLNRDGLVGIADLAIFHNALLRGDRNSSLCIQLIPEIDPWDSYGHAFVSPGTQSGVDLLTVTVVDELGNPVPCIAVEVQFGNCAVLCVDDPSGLAGETDDNGQVVLDPRVGGCAECPVLILVDGEVVRQFDRILSTDWNGTCADGVVDDADVDFFQLALGNQLTDCADYNGDGFVGLADAQLLAQAQNAGDMNTEACVGGAVDPWDLYGQALVSPGTQSGIDELTIHVWDEDNVPLVGVPVEIVFEGCNVLCIDDPAGLSGTTDSDGVVVLDPRVGGCEDCTVSVVACGVVIAQYDRVVSPDWDGVAADGMVGVDDLAYYNVAKMLGEICTDLDGDGQTAGDDDDLFNAAFIAGDANNELCQTAAIIDEPGHSDHGDKQGALELSAPTPSPTRGSFGYSVTLPVETQVRLSVYDANGRLVGNAFAGRLGAGTHDLAWSPHDAAGQKLGGGVYFLRLEAAGASRTQKFIVVR